MAEALQQADRLGAALQTPAHVEELPALAARQVLRRQPGKGRQRDHQVFEDFKLPEDKYLVVGVIDTKTNYVEHPELVAQRIKSYTDVLGTERVVASIFRPDTDPSRT